MQDEVNGSERMVNLLTLLNLLARCIGLTKPFHIFLSFGPPLP
jgi:hypothetical protein